LRHRQVDNRGNCRRGIADRLGVEAVQRGDEHAQNQNADLKPRDRMAVN
jgi:hypothetical protein